MGLELALAVCETAGCSCALSTSSSCMQRSVHLNSVMLVKRSVFSHACQKKCFQPGHACQKKCFQPQSNYYVNLKIRVVEGLDHHTKIPNTPRSLKAAFSFCDSPPIPPSKFSLLQISESASACRNHERIYLNLPKPYQDSEHHTKIPLPQQIPRVL